MKNNDDLDETERDKRLTIYTDTDKDGNWVFVDNGGNILQDEKFDTREEAQAAAPVLWPANSVWKGRQDGDGWSILI